MAKVYVDRKGYRRFSDSGILVSRWVATKKLGRPLQSGEVVHHINRDKLDNSRENIWAFRNQSQHNNTHKKDKRNTGFW